MVHKTEIVDVVKTVEELKAELQWELRSGLWQQLVEVLREAAGMQIDISL